MKDLLQSLLALSEGETKETGKGRVHKGSYGSEYETDREGNEKKKDAPAAKKGRGRPKKDADETGEVKKYDSSALSNVFGGGKKPKKEVGTVSKKHSLKEYMESVEDTKNAEAVMEGMFGGVDHTSVAGNLGKLARVIKSVQTPEQFAVAQKYARRMNGTIMNHQHDKMGFGSGLRANLAVMRAVEADLKAKAAELGIDYKPLDEAEQVTIAPAQQNTQIIKQGDDVLGSVTNPSLAATIKNAIGKGEMSLSPGQEKMAEGKGQKYSVVKNGKVTKSFDSAAKAKDYAAKFGGTIKDNNKKIEEAKLADKDYDGDGKVESGKDEHKGAVTKAINKALGKDVKKKVDESITIAESPETLQHIINKYKHEVKNFINGEELDHDLYEALFDYYFNAGEMPYGTAKGRTGDPYEWITQRFDQDVHDYVVDEGATRDFAMRGIGPTNDFSTSPEATMAVPKGTPTKPNRPVEEPTPWSVDPINAATDRAFNFVSSLGKKSPFKESTDMKDIQVESWEKQLNGLLKEGLTVSSSTGQQGQPNSVTVSATENDADQLMQVLRSAGIGGFGAEQGAPEIGYGVAQGGEEEFDGTGTEPQPAPGVVGDDGDMLSMLKKMAGLSGGDTEVVAVSGDEEGGQDYEDEEGSDEQSQTLEPADDGEEDGEEQSSGDEDSDDEGSEETDEGNAFTGKLKQTPQGGNFKMGDKSYKDTSSIEEGGFDPEQFGSDGSGAGGAGGGDEEESVEEGVMGGAVGAGLGALAAGPVGAALGGALGGNLEENCHECGMMEEECQCDHEHVEENFANSANDPAEAEFAKLKALLSMGNDLHKMKTSQALGNPIKVAEATQAINDWKKLSGIK